jgi:hypothetical protein
MKITTLKYSDINQYFEVTTSAQKGMCALQQETNTLIAKVEIFSKNAPYSTRGQFQV